MGERFDSVVIGGGSGGLSFAKRAAALGARVALIEAAELGGTCVNRGCVPKKLMWQAARVMGEIRSAADLGVASPAALDFPALAGRVAAKIASIRNSFEGALDQAGVELIRGEARAWGRDRIEVAGRTLSADHLVLAAGARPSPLDIEGAEAMETSDDVLAWRTLPGSLVILGAGYIGCEFAAIFASMGVAVTVIDPSERVLSPFDADLARAAERSLGSLGVEVRLGVTPEAVQPAEGGLRVACDDGSRATGARVVNATGRQPRLDGLGPIAYRLDVAGSGALAVDDRLGTSEDGVHALGDMADRLPLTPVADRDGMCLAEMLHGAGGAPIPLELVARAAFVIPPVAQVGRPEGEAHEGTQLQGDVVAPEGDVRTVHKMGFDEGGRFTGLAVAGEHAPEIVGAASALLGARADRDAIRAVTGIHPTFAEEMLGLG